MISKNQRIIYKFILSLSLTVCVPAWADVQYVIEQNLENRMQDMYNLNKQMNSGIQQNAYATQAMKNVLQNSLAGASGLGLINNPVDEQKFRDWTPSVEDLANMTAQGLQTGSLADQIKYYHEKFQIPSAARLTPGNPHSPVADYGIFSAVTTNAALTVADKSFNNVPQIQLQINSLYQQLDRQSTLKQAQDFNSVIMLRIAALQTDLIRLQSQQLKIQAVSQQENNLKRTTMITFIQDIK